MGATLILVNSWTNPDYLGSQNKTAVAMNINANNILKVTTRTTALNTTGVTDILYDMPINQMHYQVVLTVTQTAAAILTAANANVIAT